MAVVWVTGASSGLGMYTAQALVNAGFTVVSGARSFIGEKTGESELGYRIPLDVTSEESMDAFCASAAALYGTPDALVCCAGVLILGASECYTDAELRRVMETNFFGQVAMIRRVLPAMREKQKGHIICFSSINGVLSTPFQGAYSASKHALEGYCESLRAELHPYHIGVTLIEPGDHKGGSQAYRNVSLGTGEDSPYRAALERVHRVIDHDESHGSDPAVLGRKVARLLLKGRHPMRRRIAQLGQHAAVFLHDLLPGDLFYWFISLYYHVEKKERKKG